MRITDDIAESTGRIPDDVHFLAIIELDACVFLVLLGVESGSQISKALGSTIAALARTSDPTVRARAEAAARENGTRAVRAVFAEIFHDVEER